MIHPPVTAAAGERDVTIELSGITHGIDASFAFAASILASLSVRASYHRAQSSYRTRYHTDVWTIAHTNAGPSRQKARPGTGKFTKILDRWRSCQFKADASLHDAPWFLRAAAERLFAQRGIIASPTLVIGTTGARSRPGCLPSDAAYALILYDRVTIVAPHARAWLVGASQTSAGRRRC